mmetsp:Transcript_83709/g.167166  ORF Transcript_83709/g.167166 Transcript_83709/m.167166 type:complete len:200 (-) Transcript_83709:482-1081(-)
MTDGGLAMRTRTDAGLAMTKMTAAGCQRGTSAVMTAGIMTIVIADMEGAEGTICHLEEPTRIDDMTTDDTTTGGGTSGTMIVGTMSGGMTIAGTMIGVRMVWTGVEAWTHRVVREPRVRRRRLRPTESRPTSSSLTSWSTERRRACVAILALLTRSVRSSLGWASRFGSPRVNARGERRTAALDHAQITKANAIDGRIM